MEQREKRLVGKVTFINGDTIEFDDAAAFIAYVRQEMPNPQTAGARYEVLADDPTTRKALDDVIYDLFGEENPCSLEDYQRRSEQSMQMGGM